MDVKGYPGANRGLKYIISYFRNNLLLPKVVLDKIERLRDIRNPFVHLKPDNHPNNLIKRMQFGKAKSPDQILESDAKEALSLMVAMLFLVPYIDRGTAGVGRWFARERLLANTIFLTMVVLNVIFIVVGTFFRGPNWSFVSPF